MLSDRLCVIGTLWVSSYVIIVRVTVCVSIGKIYVSYDQSIYSCVVWCDSLYMIVMLSECLCSWMCYVTACVH